MRKSTASVFILAALFVSACSRPPGQPDTELPEGAIVNLYDAFGKDTTLVKDFGFSCITRYNGKTILFDSGSNAEVFKKNTDRLGIDLKTVDIAIISHAHFDHINGMDHLLEVNPDVKIYFPFDIFWGAPAPFDATGQEAGVKDSLPVHMRYFDGGDTRFTIQQSGRFRNADVEFIQASKEILPGLTLIATRSEYMGYFSCYPNKSFVQGEFEEGGHECRNNNLPELSLAMKTDKGRVLIVGCSHTGVENIVQEAQAVTQDVIDLVYGGFHMLPFDRAQTHDLVNLLKNDLQVRRVAPAHCTGHLAFKLLMEAYQEDYVYAGLGEPIFY